MSVISRLDRDVAAFIESSISSVAQLDVLAHVAAAPSQRASVAEIARGLAFDRSNVEAWTRALCDDGLLSVDPADGRLRLVADGPGREVVAKVLRAYRTHRVAVVATIISKHVDVDE